jgi:hypothetical protein
MLKRFRSIWRFTCGEPMNRSTVAKITLAFVAGLVLTMGALVYSRNRELTQVRKAVQRAPSFVASAPGEPSAETGAGPEDVKASGAPVQALDAESNTRVATEVQKLTLPARAARASPLTDRGSEVGQATAPRTVPNTIPPAAAPGSATEPNHISAEGQHPPNVETTPEPRKPNLIILQPGTSVTVRLDESVSTDRNRRGDTFRATLDSPLIVNGFVLAERGARVLGKIERVRKARLLRGKSGLRLRVTEIMTRDGQRVRIETSPWEEKGARSSIGNRPKMAAGAALGAVVGALTGAAKGAGFVSDESGARKGTLGGAHKRTLVVTTGARLTFRVARPVTITEKLNYAETRN